MNLQIEPDFFDKIIIRDETCAFEYDTETKRQSTEWHILASSRQRKAKLSKQKVKTILVEQTLNVAY